MNYSRKNMIARGLRDARQARPVLGATIYSLPRPGASSSWLSEVLTHILWSLFTVYVLICLVRVIEILRVLVPIMCDENSPQMQPYSAGCSGDATAA